MQFLGHVNLQYCNLPILRLGNEAIFSPEVLQYDDEAMPSLFNSVICLAIFWALLCDNNAVM